MTTQKIVSYVNTLIFITLLLVSASIVEAIYLYNFHENPASIIKNSPMPVDKEQYHPGDIVYATFDYCRYTDVPVTRYVTFFDGLSFALPPVTVYGGKVGCHIQQTVIATIPESLPPGTYHIVGKSEFKVNFLATRYTNWETEEFEVIK